jgi:ATP-binding cassette subfamily F protein 3
VFVGNITYYLDKTAEEAKAEKNAAAKLSKRPAVQQVVKPIVAAQPVATTPDQAGNRKDQRRQEAEQRQKRTQVLKPLESELTALEAKIAELEAAQATLTEHLSDQSVATDPDKFRQATLAVANVTQSLELAFSRWSELSDQIEKLNAELG